MKIIVAKTFKQKLIGLMGKKNIDYGMFFPNVNSIHTFFMRENIDILGLDKDLKIKEKYLNISPNHTIFLKKSVHTLELPAGYGKNYQINQRINLEF